MAETPREALLRSIGVVLPGLGHGAARALGDALSGERIAVVGAPFRAARKVYDDLRDALPTVSFVKVRRANGDEYLELPGGGSIRFLPGLPHGDSLRGSAFDRVYLTGWKMPDDVARDAEYNTSASRVEGERVAWIA